MRVAAPEFITLFLLQSTSQWEGYIAVSHEVAKAWTRATEGSITESQSCSEPGDVERWAALR